MHSPCSCWPIYDSAVSRPRQQTMRIEEDSCQCKGRLMGKIQEAVPFRLEKPAHLLRLTLMPHTHQSKICEYQSQAASSNQMQSKHPGGISSFFASFFPVCIPTPILVRTSCYSENSTELNQGPPSGLGYKTFRKNLFLFSLLFQLCCLFLSPESVSGACHMLHQLPSLAFQASTSIICDYQSVEKIIHLSLFTELCPAPALRHT